MEAKLAGHYQIVRPLGGGAFGQTFLAQDIHLPGQPLCVVKQLKPRAQDQFSLGVAKRLFDREAETLYRLGNHDQIPRLLAHFEQDDEFYLVQDYIPGQTLDQEILTDRPLSETTVIELLLDILRVLAFVHQNQVIHRDIKPSNLIRRERDRQIVLIDFGAVKEVSQTTAYMSGGAPPTVAIGTPGYLPSEQRAFQPRFSSDVYAVGILAMQALSGLKPDNLPVDPATGEISCAGFQQRIPVHPRLAEILDCMVRYDYRQRYTTAMEALQTLEQWLNTANRSTLAHPFPTPPESIYSSQVQPAPPAGASPSTPSPAITPTGSSARPSSVPPSFTPVPSIASPPPVARRSPVILDLPEDLRHQLQTLLTQYVGPIAPLLMQSIQGRVMTTDELIARLASRIPEADHARFQQAVADILKQFEDRPTNPSSPPISLSEQTTPDAVTTAVPSAPVITPQFAQRCEAELAKHIGPIAPVLVQRAIASNTSQSASQLVEDLARHIKDESAAAAFRKILLALLQ